jgi:hypothetical protein
MLLCVRFITHMFKSIQALILSSLIVNNKIMMKNGNKKKFFFNNMEDFSASTFCFPKFFVLIEKKDHLFIGVNHAVHLN